LNGIPCTFSTASIKITVVADPNISTDPLSKTICNGTTWTMTTSATGGTPSILYQWQSSPSNTPYVWSNITGATTTSYTTPALTTTTYYHVIATAAGLGCNPDTSAAAEVKVNNLTPGEIAGDQTICNNDDPIAFTSSSPASSLLSGVITYQWERATTNTPYNWTSISGATDVVYNESVIPSDRWYRRVATSTLDGVPCTSSSNILFIVVNNLNAGSTAASQTICNGIEALPFTSVAATTIPNPHGTAVITYQWQVSSTGHPYSWTNIPAATNATYASGIHTLDKWYQRVATSTMNGKVCTANSNVDSIIVNNLTPGSISGDQTICSGTYPIAFTNLTPATATQPTAVITYQWQYSDAGPPTYVWNNISGATNSGYGPPVSPLTNDRYYQRVATATLSGSSCTSATNIIIVTVNNVTPGSIAGNESICNGGDPTAFTSPNPQPTGDGNLTYQWQESSTGLSGSWSDIFGAIDLTFDPSGPMTADKWYRRVTTSTIIADPVLCTATSNEVKVSVYPDPTVVVSPENQTICTNGTVTFTATPANGVTGSTYYYQWQRSTNDCSGPDWDDLIGATTSTYTPRIASFMQFVRNT
jgi:hypothetical protein